MAETQPNPWARPEYSALSPETDGPDRETVLSEQLRRWRARAAATADPAWSRVGTGRGPDGAEVGSAPADAGRASTLGRDREGEGWAALTPSDAWPPATAWDGPTSPTGARLDWLRWWLGQAARSVLRRCWWLLPPLTVVAGAGVVVASSMTWATVRAFGFAEFTVRGTDPDQHGQLTMVLGILAMVSGLLLTGRRIAWGRMLAGMTGLMTMLTAFVDIIHLHRGGLLLGSGLDATTTIGPGLWIIFGCGGMAFILGAVAQPYPCPGTHTASGG